MAQDRPARAAPPPVPAILLPTSPRYPYLVGRLRSRQITMEEATELFGLMQESLAMASQAIRQAAALPPPPGAGVPAPGSTGPRPGPGLQVRDEDVGLGLLALGAGAGLLAAILKRSSEGPRSTGSK
jgi:hypothetical protein